MGAHRGGRRAGPRAARRPVGPHAYDRRLAPLSIWRAGAVGRAAWRAARLRPGRARLVGAGADGREAKGAARPCRRRVGQPPARCNGHRRGRRSAGRRAARAGRPGLLAAARGRAHRSRVSPLKGETAAGLGRERAACRLDAHVVCAAHGPQCPRRPPSPPPLRPARRAHRPAAHLRAQWVHAHPVGTDRGARAAGARAARPPTLRRAAARAPEPPPRAPPRALSRTPPALASPRPS